MLIFMIEWPLVLNSYYSDEQEGGHVWDTQISTGKMRRISPAFEQTSKRKRGYPSESAVKRGIRVVHGDKALYEKLGKEDLCPCGSGHRFQAVLSQEWQV